MKYFLILIITFAFLSCSNQPKPKAADNAEAAQDTSKKVDTKKKAILNHRF